MTKRVLVAAFLAAMLVLCLPGFALAEVPPAPVTGVEVHFLSQADTLTIPTPNPDHPEYFAPDVTLEVSWQTPAASADATIAIGVDQAPFVFADPWTWDHLTPLEKFYHLKGPVTSITVTMTPVMIWGCDYMYDVTAWRITDTTASAPTYITAAVVTSTPSPVFNAKTSAGKLDWDNFRPVYWDGSQWVNAGVSGQGGPIGTLNINVTRDGHSWTSASVDGTATSWPLPFLGLGHTYTFSVTRSFEGKTSPAVRTTVTPGATRLGGADRYATAIQVSRHAFPGGANAAVIAFGGNYPDALTAGPLAKAYNGPVLLTPTAALRADVLAELKRLAPKQVFVVGSESVVSRHVADQLKGLPGSPLVTRLGGKDRFETCAKIADQVKAKLGSVDKVMVATGYGYADALSAGPLAAAKGWPILLVQPNAVPSPISGALARLAPSSTIVVGGTGVVSDTVMNRFPNAKRVSGPNRYETCGAILDYAKTQGVNVAHVALTVGTNFPDGLTAGPYLAQDDGLLLLTTTDSLSTPEGTRLSDNKATIMKLDVIGSTGVVSNAVVSQALAKLR